MTLTMYSSSPRRCLAAAVAIALLHGLVDASTHRRSVPPFQIKPTHQVSAKSMSGPPSISWPNAHANETYIALGLEIPIVGIVGNDPELIFLGAESYLLFMQEGMTMSAYNHLNISDNLLSSSIDPLVLFNEPSGIFSDSPFSSSSGSADLRLLAVLLYKADTQGSQSAAAVAAQGSSSSSSSSSSLSSSSSSSDSVLSGIADFMDGESQEDTEDFDWNAWAADMNANPLLRMNFDIGDFAAKAGLGSPVAAEVLMVKDEAELTDALDVSGSWDVVSTLYQTGAGVGNAAATATGMGAAVSGVINPVATGVRGGAPGLGLMPSGTGAAGIAMSPNGAVSGYAAAAAAAAAATTTGSPFTSTGSDESNSDSEDTGVEPAIASDGSAPSADADFQDTSASPTGFATSSAAGGSSPGGLVVVPIASNSAARPADTGSPSTSMQAIGASGDGSDDDCDDNDDDDDGDVYGSGSPLGAGAGAGASGSLPLPTGAARPGSLSPSGMSKQPKYSFPQFSGAAGGVPSLIHASAATGQTNAAASPKPTGSAVGAAITGAAASHGEQMTVNIDIDGIFETTITANLKNRHARRTVDAKQGWTLTLKTDLVAPTSSLVKMAEATVSTAVPTSTPDSVGQFTYQHESSSTLQTIATASPASGSASATSFVTTSSASRCVLPAQVLSFVGLVCVSLFSVQFL